MLPVVVNVCLSVRGCYACSATAAKLSAHYPLVKDLCSTNLCNMYMHPPYMHLSAMYMHLLQNKFICAHTDFLRAGDSAETCTESVCSMYIKGKEKQTSCQYDNE